MYNPHLPPRSAASTPPLSESDYQRLREEVAHELRYEMRKMGYQKLFTMALQGAILVFLAVILFLAARRYHDFMLWAVGLCLLLFGCLEFLDLEYLHSGHNWMDNFKSGKKRLH